MERKADTIARSANRDALEAIRAITEALHQSLDFEVIAERALEAILAYKPFAAASILTLDETRENFEVVASRGFPEQMERDETRIPVEGSLMGHALREGRVVLSDDLSREPHGIERLKRALVRGGFTKALVVPLIHGSEPLGSMNVVLQARHALSGRERETLLAIGRTIALALADAGHVELLRANEQRYSMATAAGGVGVWDWDLAASTFYLDPNVKAILGYGDDEIPNELEAWSRHIHPDDGDRVSRAIQDYLAARSGEFACEHRMIHKDGSVRWILARGTAVRDAAGGVVRLVGTDVDITERKRLEDRGRALQEQLIHAEKLKSLGVLAGGIAHDFNNLLTTIMGNAGLALARMDGDSPARRPIEQIDTAASRAAELTRQLLAYSGKGAFVVRAVDLSRLVAEMTDLLGVSISKKARLEYRFAEDLPWVEADPAQLQQVVMNLITNASEALGEGPGTIRVRTGAAERGHVFLEIADDGCGMDEEVRSRIFDPFFTTKFTGRGLGLAAVQGIVQGQGGALRVESEPGRGTTVTVLLPAASPGVSMPAEERPTEVTDPGHGTVLVADDEAGVRQLARTVLEEAGFTVLTACDGREAVDLFTRRPAEIRLVLLDLTMPRMSGHEALREIRRIRPDVSVVLSSGYPESDAVRASDGDGSVGVLQKPYGPPALIHAVRRALAR